MNRVLAVLGAALIIATGVVFATYGGSDDGAAAAEDAPAVAVDKVAIEDFKFVPAAITVPVGTTITWTNADSAPHTATSGMSPTPDDVFDTDIIRKDESKTFKASKPGTFAYYCALHAYMQGTVTVR